MLGRFGHHREPGEWFGATGLRVFNARAVVMDGVVPLKGGNLMTTFQHHSTRQAGVP